MRNKVKMSVENKKEKFDKYHRNRKKEAVVIGRDGNVISVLLWASG